eukprot:4524635-Pyramimonas_sp.AAC.1
MRAGGTGAVGLPPAGPPTAPVHSLGGLTREASPSSLSGRPSGKPPGQAGLIQSVGWRRPLRLTGGTPKESSR